jgi:hypothetical protein
VACATRDLRDHRYIRSRGRRDRLAYDTSRTAEQDAEEKALDLLDKRRPALLLSPDVRNDHRWDVIVIPASTVMREGHGAPAPRGWPVSTRERRRSPSFPGAPVPGPRVDRQTHFAVPR